MAVPRFSFEFYPPRDGDLSIIARAVRRFNVFEPLFYDVAYGAGGQDVSDRQNMHTAVKTLNVASTVAMNAEGVDVMVHTPASRFSHEGFGIFFKRLIKAGISRIMVMSGDGQKFHTGKDEGERPGYDKSEQLIAALPAFQQQYANDYTIDVTVVVEPEKPDAMKELKKKIAAISAESGGKVRVTQAILQYSYDPQVIVNFLKAAEEEKLGIEIVAGVMPFLKKPEFSEKPWAKGVISDELGVPIKPGVMERYANVDSSNPKAVGNTGMQMTIELLKALKTAGVEQVHFYGANAHNHTLEAIAAVWGEELKLQIEQARSLTRGGPLGVRNAPMARMVA